MTFFNHLSATLLLSSLWMLSYFCAPLDVSYPTCSKPNDLSASSGPSRFFVFFPHKSTPYAIPAQSLEDLFESEEIIAKNAVDLFGEDCVLTPRYYDTFHKTGDGKMDVTIRVSEYDESSKRITWGLLKDLFAQTSQLREVKKWDVYPSVGVTIYEAAPDGSRKEAAYAFIHTKPLLSMQDSLSNSTVDTLSPHTS